MPFSGLLARFDGFRDVGKGDGSLLNGRYARGQRRTTATSTKLTWHCEIGIFIKKTVRWREGGMPGTDYREISQQYAQGAIKAIILVNGGSAVAVLSQLKDLSNLLPLWSIGVSLILFVFGVAVGSGCWIVGFIATRYVDRAILGQDPDYTIANRWMYFGEALTLLGVILFLLGGLLLAIVFIC